MSRGVIDEHDFFSFLYFGVFCFQRNNSRILSHDYLFRSKINKCSGWLDNDGLMVAFLVVVVAWKRRKHEITVYSILPKNNINSYTAWETHFTWAKNELEKIGIADASNCWLRKRMTYG